MSTNSLPVINLDDYVGTSLLTLNSNFEVLASRQTQTYNNSISLQNSLQILNTALTGLSALLPRIAKCQVAFNGSTTPPTILTEQFSSAHKVVNVTRPSTGVYALSFVPPFPNTNYALIATTQETLNGTDYVWARPTTFTTTSADIIVKSLSGTSINSSYITVTIFNN